MATSTDQVIPLPPELSSKLDRQLLVWREKLLALDRRQRLLYFKHTKVGSLEIAQPEPEVLLQLIASGELTVRRQDDEQRRGGRSVYVADKTQDALTASLRRIDTQSNQAYNDRGLWTLNLGLWMVHWTDATSKGEEVDSPLLLVPVRAEKAGADQPYVLTRTEDDITVNPALKLKMEQFGLQLPDIDPDDASFDIFISRVEGMVRSHPGWSVARRVVLSNFTFHKEAMYRDLVENHGAVSEHALVQLLSLGPEAPSSGDYGFAEMPLESLDDARPPEEMFSILDADSTQRRCILTALSGKSFVMDGPPGTGKSQTIANMIAELIAVDKTVLFVSEKAAALDVVRDRLDNAHLRHFLFELHSHAATRKSVAQELGKSLRERPRVTTSFDNSDSDRLKKTRHELTDFAHAMNEVDSGLRQNVFGVVGRLTELGEKVDVSLDANSRWTKLTAALLENIRSHADRLGKLWYVVEARDQFMWRGMASSDLDGTDAVRYSRTAKRVVESAQTLLTRLDTIDDETVVHRGDTVRDLDKRIDLLKLLDTRVGTPASWYAAHDLRAVGVRLIDARTAVTEIRSYMEMVEHLAGDRWREIDVEQRESLLSKLADSVDVSLTASDLNTALATMTQMGTNLATVVNGSAELCGLLGLPVDTLTMARVQDVVDLAMLSGQSDLPESSWLNAAMLDRVHESIDILESVVAHANRREESLKGVFSLDALNLDLTALSVRFRDVHTGFRKWSGAARADKKLLRQVSVSGRVDQTVIARLDEAASWQLAVREVAQKEVAHEGKLGSKYRGRATEFERARVALQNARRAVALAGTDIDAATLSEQISEDGQTDPRLLLVAEQTRRALGEWSKDLATLGPNASASLKTSSLLSQTTTWLRRTADTYSKMLAAVHHVSSIAQQALTIEDTGQILDGVHLILEKEAQLEAHREFDLQVFGSVLGMETDYDAYDQQLAHANEVQALLGGPASSDVAEALCAARSTASELLDVREAFDRDREAFLRLFDSDRRAEIDLELTAGVKHFQDLLQDFESSALSQIEPWCHTTSELRWFADLGYGDVLTALERQPRTPDEVARVLEYAALEAWIDSRTKNDRRLKRYRAFDRDEEVQTFKDLDTQLVNNARARVIERCNNRAPVNMNSRAAQILIRESEKKTRHKSVRRLLEETGPLVQQIKPCFMMSPLAVSQYLPPDMQFDVVVFDEASQVLPSDAVNCIYRGDQLIVAGDQKQLPPTDFFSAGSDESDSDEEDEPDVFDSVLDLAKGAGGLTSLPLDWHYRSRHEDLISYSNYRFYNGKLHTFPGAVFDAPDLGVELLYVNGTYRRGTSRDNPIEATKVAERVAWFRENYPNDSIGVVTFSATQEDCILAEIDRQSKTTRSLVGITNEHDRLDGFFIKSLEKVQGDERDIIIFSLGYGPDENGKFLSNFGPLNRSGGWRRLNVAITRARKRVEIVSSFRAADMPDSANESIRHLRNYLDFAERGQKALALDLADSEGDVESPFEEQVVSVIRGWGYEVVPQVGVAGYRIDMAVRHPTRPGLYVLGIECDGAAYHSGKTARDRDRLREQVLRNLGWSVYRIWGLSWWRDRAAQELILHKAITDAINVADEPHSAHASGAAARDAVGPTVEYETIEPAKGRDWTSPYFEFTDAVEATRDVKTPEGRRDAKRFLSQVIRVESPVHQEVLYERFKGVWGVQRLGVVLKKEVDAALSQANPQGADTDGFHRLGAENRGVVRVPENGRGLRKFEHISPEELVIALCRVVQESVAIDEKNLMAQVTQIFGWQKVTPDVRAVLDKTLDKALGEGLIQRDSSGDFVLVFQSGGA